MSYITHDRFLLVVVGGWSRKERENHRRIQQSQWAAAGGREVSPGPIRNAFPRRKGADRREVLAVSAYLAIEGDRRASQPRLAHLWREIVRGTKMKRELCDYMCGHESKSGTWARCGKRKVAVLVKEMSLFPRFKVPR